MIAIYILLFIVVIILIPVGIRGSIAYKKKCIEQKAESMGYDLKFDQENRAYHSTETTNADKESYKGQ